MMNIINTPNLDQAKNRIKKSISIKEKPIIVKAQNPEFNRKILEYGKFDIILSIESTAEKLTRPKQIDSAFNHVLAKIATKNKIAVGIGLEEIRSLNKKQKALRLEKVIQNIKICRKAKTKMKLLNINNERNAHAFLLSLGASTQQAQEAIF